MNDFDKVAVYEDEWPLLSFRKRVLYLMQVISYYCYILIKSEYFEGLALLVIIANSIVLVLDNPLDKNPNPLLAELDLIFLIFYTAEMGLKMIGLGLLFSKNAYLRDSWNLLDIVIVFTA